MADPETLALDARTLNRAGDVIATRYVLGELLGVGGMGVVYAATQRSLERTVAIKMLRPDVVTNPGVKERFRCEALAGSRIDHRNVVRVLDFGEDNGAPFLVMERVKGARLGTLLVDHGPIPCARAVALVREIVAGLEEAHAKGIVHADVKADNVLLETLPDGAVVPRLIDFGISRFATERVRGTRQSMVSGTPEYVAPEVIRGGAPTFASDVYAVGVMLYEMITGATPFSGDSARAMSSKLEDDAVPMSWRAVELRIPTVLDELVACALARDPASRYVNATALGKALDAVLRGPALAAPAPPPGTVTAFSTEETTAPICVEPPRPLAKIARCRDAVRSAITAGQIDEIAVAYLDLARALVDDHRLGTAVRELEEGVALLSQFDGAGPVWRLLLTLAALHDGNGDRPRARVVALQARERAAAAGSAVGLERARALCARLARRRSTSRRSSPW